MPQTVGKVVSQRFNAPGELRTFEKGKVELVTVEGSVVGRATFEPGWNWSTCVAPIAKTDSSFLLPALWNPGHSYDRWGRDSHKSG